MMWEKYFLGHGAAVLAVVFSLSSARASEPELSREAHLGALRFRSIGPAVMGGRIDDIAVAHDRPWIVYVGSASGGLWKTENNGTTWTPVFDDQRSSSVGDVALAPSDTGIVWVGTGEPNNRQSSTFGDGVYRSMDGGRTWRHLGLQDTHHIGRIVIHPRDSTLVYVAALGHLWGPNQERGVFRTTDGGASWEKVLYIDEDTGAVDLAMDPVNPRILYAAAYQRRRTPWGFNGGGPGSGIYKTTDGGDTWREVTEGIPEGPTGRIGLDISPRNPGLVYAIVENKNGGVFRSEDRGESWERVNELNPRPMYYSQIRIDPSDSRRIYVLGAPFYYSDDGGRTFVRNTEMTPSYDVGVHGDHHALWVDPANVNHLILGGDGGLYVSWDRSRTWNKIDNLPIAQFYSIGVDMQEPYFIYGGAQDTHSWGGPSATRNHIGILNSDWVQINFGDGMYQRVDPTDPDIVYTESQGGDIVRFHRRTGERSHIKPYPEEGEAEYRFHWTAPIEISPHDSKTIYFGGNRLFMSRDRGVSWAATEDLTWAENRDELPIMGAMPDENMLSRHDGVGAWGTITTVAESSLSPGLLYVGTDDGRVQMSRDGGATWTSMEDRLPALKEKRAMVTRVLASGAKPGRAYVTFDRHRLDDFAPYVFLTDDYGKSWRPIHGDLPVSGWVNVIAEHPRNPNLLFVGTETGLFVSLDRGGRWTRLRGNFPTVPVDDLMIHPRDNDLVVGTHGRAIYILDDLTPLVELDAGVASSDAYLFRPRPVVEFLPWKHESYGAQGQYVGANPPYGAILSFYLKQKPATKDQVKVSILDGNGNALRRIDGEWERGINRTAWDLRRSAPEELQSGRGPLVPPGHYTVRLEGEGWSKEVALEVRLDPRADVSVEALQSRYQFLVQVSRLRGTIEQAIDRTDAIIRQARTLLDSHGEQLSEPVKSSAETVLEDGEHMLGQMRGSEVGRDFGNPSLRSLARRLYAELDGNAVRQGTFSAPTAVQLGRLVLLTGRFNDQLASLNQLIETSIPELNRRIEAEKLPWIRVGETIRLPQ